MITVEAPGWQGALVGSGSHDATVTTDLSGAEPPML